VIWSSVPEPGPEGPASQMPTWNPAAPPGFTQSNVGFWQYIEDVYLAPDGVSRVDLDEARDTNAMINIW